MRTYEVAYRMHDNVGDVRYTIVKAVNVEEAWAKVACAPVNEELPEEDWEYPYSAWVVCSISKTGARHYFNTCEGCCY